jgi:transcriptional regulator with XRE-family HTH domain
MKTEDSRASLSVSVVDLPRERFVEFLVEQAKSGVSQQDLARQLDVAPQYISDLKTGRRRISELFARRLEDKFHQSRNWFLGREEEPDPGWPPPHGFQLRSARMYLPVLRRPISGDPRRHRYWSGAEIEICGIAASWGLASRLPYVLQFGVDDRLGRLSSNHQLLISQDINNDATIFVLELKAECFLARRKPRDGWEPLSPRRRNVAGASIVGHAVGIVWAAL